MSEQNEMKIPVLKKESKVQVVCDYSESASIVNAIFYIAQGWDENKVQEFKSLVEKREQLKDPLMITYVYLDRLYKKILAAAKEADFIEYVSADISIDPLQKSV